jgi:Helix-turn-helix domain
VRNPLRPPQPASAASADVVAERPTQPERSVQSLLKSRKSSSAANEGRKRGLTTRYAVGARSPQRELAEVLVKITVPDGKGGQRVLRTAEIERQLITRLHIPRNSAMRAATRAVQALDPGNDDRRTHKRPIAREVTPKMRRQMRALRRAGATVRGIARALGCDPKTVSRHLK